MPARNYKAQSDLAIIIEIYMDNSAIWPVNMKPQNKQTHCQISPRSACNSCGNTRKISSMLIYGVK